MRVDLSSLDFRSGRRGGLAALAAALVLGAGSPARAQVPYFASQSPAPYVPLVGGNTVAFSSQDDDTTMVPIGFDFVYYGQVYRHVNIGTNGAMALARSCTVDAECGGGFFGGTCAPGVNACEAFISTSAPSFSGPAFPSDDDPNSVIAAWWDDLHIQGGSVRYQVLGAAPDRELVVEWSNVRHFSGQTSRANFQIRLVEASGAVLLAYGTPVTGPDTGVWTGAMGIENHDGLEGLPGRPCANTTAGCPWAELLGLQGQVIQFIGPTGPELVVSGEASTGGQPGDPVLVTLTARNLGPQATGAGFDVAVRFSADETIDAADTLLTTVPFPALAARGVATATVTVTVPGVPTGYYALGGVIDPANAVAEDVETNNAALFRTGFLVGADLAVEVDTPADSGPGEPLVVTTRVLNLGAALPAVGVSVYFSRDQTLDAQDVLLGTSTVAVPSQPSTVVEVPVVVPALIPGRYYTIAAVDPSGAILEADETNNRAVSARASELQGADLLVEAVRGAAAFAFRGSPFEVTFTLRNEGLASAAGFSVAVFLSENTLISAISDPMLGEVGPLDLGPGQSVTLTRTFPVPAGLAPRAYYLGVIANHTNVVLEERLNNNTARQTATIDVRDPEPDLRVAAVRPQMMAAAGESMFVERVLVNAGNAPATVAFGAFLVPGETFDPATAIALGAVTRTLPAFAEESGVDDLLVPADAAPGTYRVAYVADPADLVPELFEDNNVLVSEAQVSVMPAALRILTRALPLATVGAGYEVVLAADGGSGTYRWSVSAGQLPAGLALDAASGRLSGTPAREGASTFTVAVSDGALTVSREFRVLAVEATVDLAVATASLPPAIVGRDYAYALTAVGGVPPYTWSVVGRGQLPAGLALSADGQLTGRASAPSVTSLTFRVVDLQGAQVDRALTFRAIEGGNAVRIRTAVLPDGRLDEAYDAQLEVEPGTGASPFAFTVIEGELPPGLALENDTGASRARVIGTPSRVGLFAFTLRVEDGRGDVDLNRYVVAIEAGDGVTFVTATEDLPRGQVGSAYTADGGEVVRLRAVSTVAGAPVTFAVASGSLPAGLALSPEGELAGTPTAEGTFTFVAAAVDAAGQREVRALTVVIDPAPVPPPPPTDGDEGCGCSAARTERGSSPLALAGLALLAFVRRRRPRALSALAVAAVVSAGGRAEAQSGAYTVSSFAQPYQARVGGTSVTFRSTDDGDAVIPLPFPFRFFTTDHTEVRVSTNGYVTFGSNGTNFGNDSFPDASAPASMIGLFWDDLSTTSVSWFVEGAAPSRTFIVQYSVSQRLGNPQGGQPQMQVHLFEGPSARFEVHYGPINGMTSPTAWSASAGFQNATGTVGFNFTSCNPNCSGTDYSALVDTVVRAQQDSGPDVAAAGLRLPAQAFLGVPFEAQVVLSSGHGNPLGPFRYDLYALAPGEAVPRTRIFRSGPVTLAPYQALTVTATPTLPLAGAAGRYRAVLVADSTGALAETDEGNNRLAPEAEVRIAPRQPDFVIAGVEAPASAMAGDSVPVTLRVRNRGNLDGAAGWRLVLSANEVISTDDAVLEEGMASLPLLTTSTVSRNVRLPAGLRPGTYWIGALVDPANAVPEIEEINNSGRAARPTAVGSGALAVATEVLPDGALGADYSFFLRASGGEGRVTWALASGMLPDGVALDAASGELRGRPSAVSRSTFTVRATSGAQRAERELALEVVEPDGGLTIVTRSLLPGVVGAFYPPAEPGTAPEAQQRLIAVHGAGEVTFRLVSPPPPGLALAPDGFLSGVPTQRGQYELQISATDGTSTATRAVALSIFEAARLGLVSQAIPVATLEEPYSFQLRVVGVESVSDVAFTASGLPPGVTLTEDGVLAGVPQRVGATVFEVVATEARTGATDAASFRLEVVQDDGFGITPGALPAGVLGEAFDAFLDARGGEAPFTWRVAGAQLPRGLRFEIDRSSGRERLHFAGTPEVESLASLLVTVRDARGRSAELALALEVRAPAPVAPPPMPMEDEGCGCAAARGQGPEGALALLALAALGLARRRRR